MMKFDGNISIGVAYQFIKKLKKFRSLGPFFILYSRFIICER